MNTGTDDETIAELDARGIPVEMWRRCVRFACRNLLNVRRTIKQSSFCSSECYRENNNAVRRFKAGTECRKCGRKARKVKKVD